MAVLEGLEATISHGVTVSNVTTYTEIADCTNIAYSPSMGSVETTKLGSAGKEYRPTLMDGGEPTFTIQFDPSGTVHALLWTLFATKAVDKWKISYPDEDSHEHTFTAFVTGFDVSGMEPEGNIEAALTLRVTGVPALGVPA